MSELPLTPDAEPIMQVPQNREAEESVIGAVLIDPLVLNDLDFLAADDFYIHRNKWVWDAFMRLKGRNDAIDIITVANELDALGRLQEIGGPAYLTAIASHYSYTYNAEDYARIVEGMARRREMIGMASVIAGAAYDTSISLGDIWLKIDGLVAGQKRGAQNILVPAEEAALNLMELVIKGVPLAIPSGLPMLDKQIGGMPMGETIMLVGDATVGKTALCLQIAETVSNQNKKVLYVSTESKAHTMVARRVCGLVGIPQKALRAGTLNDQQKDAMQKEIRDYMSRHSGTLYFDDVSYSAAAIERSIAQLRPDFIVVDYLGELSTTDDNKTLGLLSDFDVLKRAAKKYNAAQIVIHTISADDARAKDENEMPNFNSLGWAKDLKYKTDILLGLYQSKEPVDMIGIEKRHLWVIKDREGSRYSRVGLRFNAQQQWYTDVLL